MKRVGKVLSVMAVLGFLGMPLAFAVGDEDQAAPPKQVHKTAGKRARTAPPHGGTRAHATTATTEAAGGGGAQNGEQPRCEKCDQLNDNTSVNKETVKGQTQQGVQPAKATGATP